MVYGGDDSFTSSTSPVVTQVVNQADTIATVISAPNPSVFGQAVTFTANVSAGEPGAGTPTGTASFFDGSTLLGSATLSGGLASLSTTSLSVGARAITIVYGGDGDFTGSTSPVVAQVVNQDSTSTTLSAAPNPSVFGQLVTFTATVSVTAPGAGTPTGTVTFMDGLTTLGSASLIEGSANFSDAALSWGTHSITAVYAGDASFTGSTSSALSQVLNQAGTDTSVVINHNPSVFGQSVTFTATITAHAPGSGTPTGTVDFYADGTLFAAVLLSGGIVTASSSSLSVASHTITAIYSGDTNFTTSSNSIMQVVNQAATSSAVASAANPSVFGQPVTFTATVSAASPGAGTPTGTVTFMEGASTLGTVSLSGGSASISTAGLSVSTHLITVVYGSDSNFLGSTSPALSQAVNQAASSPTVASTANPSVFGQSVTFTATVAAASPGAGTPTGTVQFFDGATSLGAPVPLSGGSASLTTSSLLAAGHTIHAVYSGDSNDMGSSTTLAEVVNKADTTATALIAPGSTIVFGQPVTLTATVVAVTPGTGTPTGSVSFFNGGHLIDTVTLVSGTASTTAPAASSTGTVGASPITVAYNGDSNFNPSSSAAVTQTVNPAGTHLALAASANPSVFAQSITFTATVSAASPGAGTPTGTITFFHDSTPVSTVAVNSAGVASFSISTLDAGSHVFTATYNGDVNFLTSNSSQVSQVVDPAATTTVVTSSVSPSLVGQTVKYTAAVTTSAAGVDGPTGTVTFFADSTPIGNPVPLAGGAASLSTSILSPGSHTIMAVYDGSTNFLGGSSAPITQIVGHASSITQLVVAPTASVIGQPVVLSAVVVIASPGAAIPTGFVTFMDGSTAIGVAELSGNTAALSLSTLPVGGHTITAVYGGDVNVTTSTSLPSSLVISRAATATFLAASTNHTSFGHTVLYTATVLVASPGSGAPSGFVVFFDGSTVLGLGTVIGGRATLAVEMTGVGQTQMISAHYSGDGGFSPSNSSVVDVSVEKSATLSVLLASQNVIGVGLVANVSVLPPGQGVPTGTVTFMFNNRSFRTVRLQNGTASRFILNRNAIGRSFSFRYNGDSNFNRSFSQAVYITRGIFQASSRPAHHLSFRAGHKAH